MLSVSFRRCQPSNLQSELGLNLLGAESLLWNRSTLRWCVCFTFLCAEPLTQSCPRLLPQSDSFLKSRWEILSVSAAREATPILVKKQAQSGMRRRPKPERRRAQIKPSLVRSPPPILSLLLRSGATQSCPGESSWPGKHFQTPPCPCLSAYPSLSPTGTLVRTCFSWLGGAVTADGNQWKESAQFRRGRRELAIDWCRK